MLIRFQRSTQRVGRASLQLLLGVVCGDTSLGLCCCRCAPPLPQRLGRTTHRQAIHHPPPTTHPPSLRLASFPTIHNFKIATSTLRPVSSCSQAWFRLRLRFRVRPRLRSGAPDGPSPGSDSDSDSDSDASVSVSVSVAASGLAAAAILLLSCSAALLLPRGCCRLFHLIFNCHRRQFRLRPVSCRVLPECLRGSDPVFVLFFKVEEIRNTSRRPKVRNCQVGSSRPQIRSFRGPVAIHSPW